MGQNQNNPTPIQLLSSLARELKNPLILIARQAELEAMNTGDEAYSSIQKTAEKSLKLIDSYLLLAQSEYGQMKLPFEAVGLGSVVHELLEEVGPLASHQQVRLVSEVRDHAVMTNSLGLKTALWCLVNLSLESAAASEVLPRQKEIIIKTRRIKNENVTVSVFGNMNMRSKNLSLARKMQGNSHLALSLHAASSGIHLAIAEMLASVSGEGLHSIRRGEMHGFSLDLNTCKQLRLV